MDDLVRYVIYRVAAVIVALLLLSLVFFSSGCAPAVPSRIDLVVSGSAGLKVDLTDLTQYFTLQCTRQLGPDATPQQISDCTAQKIQDFVNFLRGIGG